MGDFTFRYNLKQFMSFVGLEDSLKIGCYLGNLCNKTDCQVKKMYLKMLGYHLMNLKDKCSCKQVLKYMSAAKG